MHKETNKHKGKSFEHPVHYFNDVLVSSLQGDDLTDFHAFKSVRVVTGYQGRELVVYEPHSRGAHVLDVVNMDEFLVDEEGGCVVLVNSEGDDLEVGYKPVRLFNNDVFVWLPLHMRVHYDVVLDHDQNLQNYSLGFNFCMKVRDRFDRDIENCLTAQEFNKLYPGTLKKG